MSDAATIDHLIDPLTPGTLFGEGGAVLADVEAEKRLIGALMLNPELSDLAVAEMTVEDLFDRAHQRMFKCFADASASGYAVGVKALIGAIGGDPETPTINGLTPGEYVAHLMACGDSATPVDELAVYLHECAERRAIETVDDDQPEPPPPFKSKMGATFFHEIGAQRPTRNWLLKNLLLASVFGIAYGPPGCGKSFLITDLALAGAAAPYLREDKRPDWFGYRGQQFGTVYVVAEGQEDFEIRLHAWRQENAIPKDAFLPFVFLPTAIDMCSNAVDTDKLVKEIAGLSAIMQQRCGVGVGLVVIDTIARALAGKNENASEVMSAFVRNCDKLQKSTKVAVIGVHHGGKEGGRGPRGHEALHGAADLEIEVSGPTEDSPNTWAVRKLKAGPGGATHRFRLRQVIVGQDADGDNITSCVVTEYARVAEQPATEDGKPVGWRISNQDAMFLTCVLDALASEESVSPSSVGLKDLSSGIARVVDYEHVKTRMARKMLREDDDTPEGRERHRTRVTNALKRARERLMGWGIIGADNPWVWFTGKPVRGFPSTFPKREIVRRQDQEPLGPAGDDITDII